jgi:hypothetical protein
LSVGRGQPVTGGVMRRAGESGRET